MIEHGGIFQPVFLGLQKERAFFHNQDLISYNTLINACTLEMFVRCLVTWEFKGRNST